MRVQVKHHLRLPVPKTAVETEGEDEGEDVVDEGLNAMMIEVVDHMEYI